MAMMLNRQEIERQNQVPTELSRMAQIKSFLATQNEQLLRIKYYANRKLYLQGLSSSTTHGYVNMTEIAELVGSGYQVEVIDQMTQKNVTKKILSSILLKRYQTNLLTLEVSDLADRVRGTRSV